MGLLQGRWKWSEPMGEFMAAKKQTQCPGKMLALYVSVNQGNFD